MAIYGVKFTQAWAGADPEEMKRAWANRLSKFDPHQVGRAIELCEESVKTPPTLPQFVEIVRSCHQPSMLQLPHMPRAPEQTEAELTVRREYPKPASGFGVWWACRIVRLAQLGEAMPNVHPLMSALKVLGLENIGELTAKYPPKVQGL